MKNIKFFSFEGTLQLTKIYLWKHVDKTILYTNWFWFYFAFSKLKLKCLKQTLKIFQTSITNWLFVHLVRNFFILFWRTGLIFKLFRVFIWPSSYKVSSKPFLNALLQTSHRWRVRLGFWCTCFLVYY